MILHNQPINHTQNSNRAQANMKPKRPMNPIVRLSEDAI